jgi:hypothetical protein
MAGGGIRGIPIIFLNGCTGSLMGWGGEYQYWLWLAPVLMFCFFILVYRNSVYRTTGITQPWRGLQLLPKDHQHVFPVVAGDLNLILVTRKK